MKVLVSLVLIFLTSSDMSAQLVVSAPLVSSYYITPESISAVQIVSPSGGIAVTVESRLTDISTGQEVLRAFSPQITLVKGINAIGNMNLQFSPQYFGSVGNYIRNNHKLPGGTFRLCITVNSNGLEDPVEECENIESETDMILSLVYPQDRDTIDTTFPMLTWMHTGDFKNASEDFRLCVVEVLNGQTSNEAIRENRILFTKSNLNNHSIQYPTSATALANGKRYAWQIELWDRNRPILSSEIWTFYISSQEPEPVMKYVKLRRGINAGVYPVIDERVYFIFDENYSSAKLPLIQLRDEFGKKVNPIVENDTGISVVEGGDVIQFVLDTGPYNLKKGSYLMTVTNTKGDKFDLTIYVE